MTWWLCRLLLACVVCLLATCRTGVQGRPSQAVAAANHHISHKRLKQSRTKIIKEDILKKLGLEQVPDVSRVNTTVEEMRNALRLYRTSLGDLHDKSHTLIDEQDYFAKTFHSFLYEGKVPASTDSHAWHSKQVQHLFFKLAIPMPADAHRETHVASATLKLNKLAVRPGNLKDKSLVERSVRVDVYQLLEPVRTNKTPLRTLIDSRMVSLESTGWEAFSVSQAVQDWVDNPDSNHGLQISCHDQPLHDLIDFALATSPSHHFLPNLTPSLNIYTQERTILGRRKRSEADLKEDCVQGDGEKKCCRFPLEIDFEAIGWGDWIVSPPSYQAYFCDGRCPHQYKTAHTFAAIKALVHRANPNAVPAPCCTASKLSGLSILHYNKEGALQVSVYEDMVVDECRCA